MSSDVNARPLLLRVLPRRAEITSTSARPAARSRRAPALRLDRVAIAAAVVVGATMAACAPRQRAIDPPRASGDGASDDAAVTQAPDGGPSPSIGPGLCAEGPTAELACERAQRHRLYPDERADLEQLLSATPASSPEHDRILFALIRAELTLACVARRECEAAAAREGDRTWRSPNGDPAAAAAAKAAAIAVDAATRLHERCRAIGGAPHAMAAPLCSPASTERRDAPAGNE